MSEVVIPQRCPICEQKIQPSEPARWVEAHRLPDARADLALGHIKMLAHVFCLDRMGIDVPKKKEGGGRAAP